MMAEMRTCSVRTTISGSHHDGPGSLTFDHEPLVGTLNNPWHVLESLGYDALASLAVSAQSRYRGTHPKGKLPCDLPTAQAY